ncbi:MAG TPA: LPS export ABC transporter permease LptG [Burkholderiaceae bacterium]|jgi:lipopolysaccharide export system permease protein
MKTLQKYFSSEIASAVLFTLVAFLALFAFFDLMNELSSVGHGGYKVQHAFLYILMGMPGYTYELMPIAVLIGTIVVMAKFSSTSEFTIMRVSGMSTAMAGWMLVKIGLVFVIVTFIFGEYLSPLASEAAGKFKLQKMGTTIANEFRSGLWTKDVIKSQGMTGDVVGSRFFNVRKIGSDGELQGVKLYEFDNDFHMTAMIIATSANYQGEHIWRLHNVTETHFSNAVFETENYSNNTVGLSTRKTESKELVSDITPAIIGVMFADPDRMSAYDLYAYTKHLAESKQVTERYEIAFWKKLVYPLAIFVMMALALPFAYLHVRSGGVSLKIFVGIMIGVSFHLVNSLFSHIGLLNTWPALLTAAFPSVLYLLIAISTLWWVQRH